MTKQSRLRIQNDKKGRRILLYTALAAVVGVAGWFLEQRYPVIASFTETLTSISKNLTQNTLRRGEFYDRNLRQIATTKERVSVYVRTQELNSIAETVKELAPILSLDEEQLKGELESGALRQWLAEDISQDQEIALKAKRLSGVYLQKEEKRVYPNNTQAAHLIGYVENGIGLAGVEFYYDRLLVTRNFGRDTQGRFNSPQDLVLTLDLKIQDILEGLVEEIKKYRKANKVLAYLMESRTGEVVGSAQLPGFNPNSFTQYSQEVLESQLVNPVLLPEKFRLFLRDAAMLRGEVGETGSLIPWSLRPGGIDLGSQLQLWDWLGLNEKTMTDFRSSAQPGEIVPGDQRPIAASPPALAMVPEQTTPLNLLTAFSVLLNGGEMVRPFVVRKSLDVETGEEVILTGEEADKLLKSQPGHHTFHDIDRLFHSQARSGEGKARFFQDKVLSETSKEGRQKFQINELLVVTIPAGGNDMTLLVAVAQDPEQPVQRSGMTRRSVEEIVEEKVERISILQQVAKSVADVVEPEMAEDGNYQGQKRTIGLSRGKPGFGESNLHVMTIMPDLRGLSLRKSLRMLQGTHVKIAIQGTGKVVEQKPPPGTPLKGVAECTLVLAKNEEVNLEKLSKGPALKK